MKLRRPFKIITRLLTMLLLLVVLLLFILNLPVTQRWLTPKLETWLEDKLQTGVEVEGVGVRFPKSLEIKGLKVDTPDGGTLLQLGSLLADVDMWDLFKSKLTIKEIGLEQAVVKIQQRDEQFNFGFIIDAFAPPDNNPGPPPTDPSSSFQVLLQPATLYLKEVVFDYENFDSQQFIHANIGKAAINVEQADFASLLFSIKKLELENSDISVRQLAVVEADSSSSPSIFDIQVETADLAHIRFLYEDEGVYFKTNIASGEIEDLLVKSNNEGILVTSMGAALDNSAFLFQGNGTSPTPNHLNPSDLDWQGLNLSLKNFSYQNNDLQVEVENLSGNEKSGVTIAALQGKLAYSPSSVVLQKMVFQGNNTTLTGEVSLDLGKTAGQPLDHFSADFKEVKSSVADLLRFLPPDPSLVFLEKMADKKWAATGKVEGSMRHFTTKGFQFSFGENSRVRLAGSAANFDNPNKLDANLQLADLQFDKNDFTALLLGKNWPLPAFLHASGEVAGRAGDLTVDLSGSFGDLDSLAVANPLPDTAFFDIAGNVGNIGDLNALTMDMVVNQLQTPGSVIENLVPKNIVLPDQISLKGVAIGTLQKLSTSIDLTALRSGQRSILTGGGSLENLTKPDSLGFDMAYSGELTKAEIFGYLPDSLLTSYVHLPPSFTLEGTAKGRSDDLVAAAVLGMDSLGFLLLDGFLKKEKYAVKVDGKQLKINQLAVDSLLQPLRLADCSFQVEGNGFDFLKDATASLTGQFNTLTWEGWTMENIELEGQLAGKKFTAKLFNPDERLHLKLSADGDLSEPVPSLGWDVMMDCIDLHAFGLSEKNTSACFQSRGQLNGFSLGTMDATVFLENIEIQQDSLSVKPGDVKLVAAFHDQKNNLHISSDWLNAWVKGQFDLAGLPQLVDDFSQHYFQTKKQQDAGQAAYTNDTLAFELTFVQPDFFSSGIVPGLYGLDSFTVSGGLDSHSRRFDFSTNLPHVNYDSWTVENLLLQAKGNGQTADFLLKIPILQQYKNEMLNDLSLAGSLDGHKADVKLTSLDSMGKERFKLGVFATTDDFEEGMTIHLLPSQLIDYQEWAVPVENEISYSDQKISIKKLFLENGGQMLHLEGSAESLPDGEQPLDFDLNMENLDLSNFEVLMSGSLKNLAGTLDGQMKIGGTSASPKPSGILQLKGAKATVGVSNVRYSLSEKELVFQPGGLDLSGLTLSDKEDNYMTINGLLKTKNWQDIEYDLFISSKKWLVLDTDKNQNPQYFGKVTAAANGTIKGPLAEPIIAISASPVKGSVFNYIYDTALDQATGDGVVVFVKPIEKKKPARKITSKQYPFQLNLNLEIDENLLLKVVADPATGDNFEGTLDGRLGLELYPDGTINLGGRCEVKKGNYRYFYQNLVKRNFEIAPGSYLAWSGDPFNPDLQITARYVVRTSPYPLLVQSGFGDNTTAPELRNYQTFFLNFKVTNDVKRPELAIDIEYPENDVVTQSEKVNNSGNGIIKTAVNALNSDDELLPQQVFGLLVFNGFIGTGTGLSGANLGLGLNDFLTSQFNALASRYIKFVEVSLDVDEDVKFDNDNQSYNATNYNLSLQKSFLNDRLTFKVSGGTAGDNTGSNNSGSQLRSSLENAEIEYSLTPNGKWKLRAFSEDGLELLNSDVIRNSGGGLVFSKEFEKVLKKKGK